MIKLMSKSADFAEIGHQTLLAGTSPVAFRIPYQAVSRKEEKLKAHIICESYVLSADSCRFFA